MVIGKVLGIALRCMDKGEMREVSEAGCVVGGGIEGDLVSSPDRGITLLSSEQWKQTTCELGVNLPWWTRRANVLIECSGLGEFIGQTIRIGQVEIKVCDETRPCDLMDRLALGLRMVLKPDRRGGVHGRITRGGKLRVGDDATVLAIDQQPADTPS